MKIDRILRILGISLIGGLLVWILLAVAVVIFRSIFFPGEPLVKHVGWIIFLQVSARTMSPGLLTGFVIAIALLKPLRGALVGLGFGLGYMALILTIDIAYDPRVMTNYFLSIMELGFIEYGIITAITGWLCGFLTTYSDAPHLEAMQQEPPQPDFLTSSKAT